MSLSSSFTSSDAEMDDVKAANFESGTLKKYQSMYNIFSEPSPSVTVSDIRQLTSKYQTLLDQATKEIQKLNQAKKTMKKEKTKLLATNVEMAKELTKIYTEQKQWREAEKGLLKANEELVAEVESLYARQESLGEENDTLLKTITILGEEKVQQKEDLSEKIEELQSHVKFLEEEKSIQDAAVETMSSELKTKRKAEKDAIYFKNENEKLKLDSDFLTATQKSSSERMQSLSKDLGTTMKELKKEQEKVKNLTAWREQLTEKNETLIAENNLLRQKSENLQQIVDEEVGDIDNILSTINLLQLQGMGTQKKN